MAESGERQDRKLNLEHRSGKRAGWMLLMILSRGHQPVLLQTATAATEHDLREAALTMSASAESRSTKHSCH